MSVRFTESYVDAVITALNDNTNGVEAKMNLVDSERNDGIVLETLKKIYKGGVHVIEELPALVVWPESGSYAVPTTATIEQKDTVIVWALIYAEDPETTHVRVWRMQEAIVRSVLTTWNLNGSVDICEFAGMRYDTPWFFPDAQGNPLLGVGGVAFEISHEEIV